jgi:hypothetical protein
MDVICRVRFTEVGVEKEIIGRLDEAQYYNKENDFITLSNYISKTICRHDIISITVIKTFETYCLI